MNRGIPAAFFVAMLACPVAHASPPEIMWVDDALFGISEQHVFVIRTTRNNLGAHIPGLSDTFVVVKNAETGEDERVLPVYRSVGLLDGDTPSQTVEPIEDAVNPYAVLADYAGRPLSPVEIEVSGIFSLDAATADFVLQRVQQSKRATAEATLPYPSFDLPRIFSTPTDLLTGSTYQKEQCSLAPMAAVQFHWDSPKRALAQIFCEHDMDPVMIIVVLPTE